MEESIPEFDTLNVSVDGRIGRLTLNQPEKLNPLGTVPLAEIADAAAWFDTTEASVVIVTGAGRGFSSGFDLREFAGGPNATPHDNRAQADLGRLMAEAMERMRALTIAAIKGPCVGGGVVLAGACDLRIAADDTVFSIPEVDLGIPLAWGGIPRLVREIPPAIVRELVLTCRPFDADEARSLGFVNRVVPRDELERGRRRTGRAARPEGAVGRSGHEASGERSAGERCLDRGGVGRRRSAGSGPRRSRGASRRPGLSRAQRPLTSTTLRRRWRAHRSATMSATPGASATAASHLGRKLLATVIGVATGAPAFARFTNETA